MGYKKNDRVLKGAGDDEPIFVLRAQDITAPRVVDYWIDANRETLSPERLAEAEQAVQEMRLWQNANESKVKIAD